MKRLLIAFLAIVMLAGCAAPAAVVGPNAATLSQGLKLEKALREVFPVNVSYTTDRDDSLTLSLNDGHCNSALSERQHDLHTSVHTLRQAVQVAVIVH